jgi:hypothetical protein
MINEPELVHGLRTAGLTTRDFVKQSDRARLLGKLKSISQCASHLSTLSPDVLLRFIDVDRDLSFKEVFEFLLPKPEGVAVWGTKSLKSVFYMREIKELYPEAIFLHIVRDPRSALLSYYRKKFTGSSESVPVFEPKAIRFFAKSTIEWCKNMAAVNGAREIFGPSSFIGIRYEQLVTQPEVEMRRVCRELGLEFDMVMLDAAIRRKDSVVTSDAGYAHKRLAGAIDPSRANTAEDLPGWACYIVEKYAKRELIDKGYSLRKLSVSAFTRLRISATLSKLKLRSELQQAESVRWQSKFQLTAD